MEAQKYFWNPLMDYWFRMEVDGWERIPDSPVLVVGIHSGAPFVWDAWTVGVQWWRHFGRSRPLHGTAHDALMALPGFGWYFRRMGVLPAAPDSITGALAAGHDVALWPGGERDSLRPWFKRDEAVLAGRTGFIRLAIRSGVPIVPVATVGGPDSMPVLATGRQAARALRLDKVFRLKMFPIALQAPWGISPALLPEIPLRRSPNRLPRSGHPRSRSRASRRRRLRARQVRRGLRKHPERDGRAARRRRLPLFG